MKTFDDATNDQIKASNPAASTWVSANAGSGKTKVLTDRVARLLLMGTNPQKILCLTYTKAAAAEMQNRLFQRLGKWAMMPENELREALANLGEPEEEFTQDKLRNARTLFAAALETPGGLKIRTIHSFCDALLRGFPLEAGISPQFAVLEDRQAKQLRAQILDDIAEGPDGAQFSTLAAYLTSDDPDDFVREVQSHFYAPKQIPTNADFDLPIGGLDTSTIDIILADPLWADLITELSASGANDQKAAKWLMQMQSTDVFAVKVTLLEKVLLLAKDSSPKIGKFPTVAIQKNNPMRQETLHQYMEHVADFRDQRLTFKVLERTKALYEFAEVFRKNYQVQKQASGLLDYDDLIHKTRALLSESSLAQWVLYKLDGGLEHILVDEAQDTSPAQWDIISRLEEEFTSGGDEDVNRTLFVVGDQKQSIYSFQGADPKYFEEMRQHFEERQKRVGKFLFKSALRFSFRTAEPILQLVDQVFLAKDQDGVEQEVLHRAFHTQKKGRVDLWPFIEKGPEPEESPWDQPLDQPSTNDPRLVLASDLASYLQGLLGSNSALPDQPDQKIEPRDILILVQKRSTLFHALIKELKSKGLPVAGADRLEIGAELAVRDVIALLKFIATPEDDLSLAEALRSPLFGWTENQLFLIAHRRPRTLWEALRSNSDTHQNTLDVLWDCLGQPDFLRPFEILDRVLIKHGGRKKLLQRLGPEAEDGIDELLSQCLRYEQLEAPTLTGFLSWFEDGSVEIKRQMDASSNQIRVMTVHAAKGLEAPIVILPDTAKSTPQDRSQIITLETETVIWKSKSDQAPAIQTASQDARKRFAQQERMRLLYVAMTRAESWLIVCGAGAKGDPQNCWYSAIEVGMQDVGARRFDDTQETLTYGSLDWVVPHIGEHPSDAQDSVLPQWALTRVPTPSRPIQALSPSNLGGAKALHKDGSDGTSDASMRFGTNVHKLLEHLAGRTPDEWSTISDKIISADTPDRSAVVEHAQRVMTAPHLAHLFANDTLAEVGIAAPLVELQRQSIDGVIDRLVVSGTHILAVDFKTNDIIPEDAHRIPDGLLRQMGAYRSALLQIYPNHQIDVAILWTKTAELMVIPHDIVMSALKLTPTS